MELVQRTATTSSLMPSVLGSCCSVSTFPPAMQASVAMVSAPAAPELTMAPGTPRRSAMRGRTSSSNSWRIDVIEGCLMNGVGHLGQQHGASVHSACRGEVDERLDANAAIDVGPFAACGQPAQPVQPLWSRQSSRRRRTWRRGRDRGVRGTGGCWSVHVSQAVSLGSAR